MYCSFEVFGLHITDSEAGWSFPSSAHNLFELTMVIEGLQRTRIGEQTYLQRPGDLLLINPGEQHDSSAPGPDGLKCLVFHFQLDMPLFRENLIRTNKVHYPADSRLAENIRPCLDKLQALIEQDGSRIRMLSDLMEAMAVIDEEFEEGDMKLGPVSPDTLRLAHRIADKMQSTLQASVSGPVVRNYVEAAAKAACVSLSHANRVFHMVYGVSPRQYLSTLRLNVAKKRLLCPDIHIEAIAQELGYASVSEFSRQFKRWTGSCPSSFRVESRRTY